ncbi:5-methyltetrahydropteroyltriglutamate--homocysteine S-methyltransferase [Brevibacterium sp. 5221]|uniref:5-methyltetrahydropteroyltriglutamate--homocysteine S-methyltransferase n=1 Tax=Brevibacterium rongguiense TaxID=2695267 RepID=A0A6N9HAC3_9MICO|nr:5-methyltetrahydropteroyltriglutamate--homocysteine S-methyltransferase [Brevibacterium rongguiense]MYM20969.1 5-methyltetrahydropteroyltriglutamate--homocysteine S-methyltransferase [Brevibacterium rongguiense]
MTILTADQHAHLQRTPFPRATIAGYPRIGPERELKRALEAHWADRITAGELDSAAHSLRLDAYRRLQELGLREDWAIPLDFALYDHVLETALTVGLLGGEAAHIDHGEYFALARGTQERQPLEMTKWFDTNYHYLVPEVADAAPLRPRPERLVALVAEARDAGVLARPVLVGPVTLLALSKAAPGAGRPLDRLPELVAAYARVLAALHEAGVAWVQLDEPALVADLDAAPDAELAGLAEDAYRTLLGAQDRPQVLVGAPYGTLRAGLGALASAAPEALAVDLSPAVLAQDPDYPRRLGREVPARTRLVAGCIDGRNVWTAELRGGLEVLATLGRGADVSVTTSTSLLHVPYTLAAETGLPVDVAGWLSFAAEKVIEVEALAAALAAGDPAVRAEAFARSDRARRTRAASGRTHDAAVRARTAGLPARVEREPLAQRRAAQERLGLPELPTTTIGSFPQTPEIRRARADVRAGRIGEEEYAALMREEIARVVRLQEQLGLDVVVHGEPERNDMVQYFAEHLEGFTTTARGWVQSYGSRCTRPPILFGDVSRPAPITVPWSQYAAGLTDRPVKGMLTGPVTILAWSFVRDDEPLSVPAAQLGVALGDEVADLERAGIPIVQVDEPALRELLPLRADARAAYLEWAVRAFRLVAFDAAAATQIHTHLCYSEFGQILTAIEALDADVTSIEAARSRMELLGELEEGFESQLGPGIYDIHSPRVPGVDELAELLRAALTRVPAGRLWVNPDCGLKTRGYAEVEAALRNLVAARDRVRAEALAGARA